MCGAAAAENTGFVEVPLVRRLFRNARRPASLSRPSTLRENANCIQAILAGRADTYVNDVNTGGSGGEGQSRQAGESARGDIPYRRASPFPKDKPEFRDAVLAALIEVQKAGIHMDLLKKWSSM